MNKDLLFLLGLTGLGLYLIFRNRAAPEPLQSFRTLRPVRRQAGAANTYKNTETMDIQWNSDGLPVRVVIHRDAVMNG